MIVQMIPVSIAAGTGAAFERTWQAQRRVFDEDASCCKAEMLRCIEGGDRYLLYVEWDSLAAHEAFQQTPARDAMLAALHPFLAVHGEITHYEAL
jgi:heme-degrading monooxygenase HmoA